MKYRDIFDTKMNEIINTTQRLLSEVDLFLDKNKLSELNDLSKFHGVKDEATKLKSKISSIAIKFDVNTIATVIDAEHSIRIEEKNRKLKDEELKIASKIEERIQSVSRNIDAKNKLIRDYNQGIQNEVDMYNSQFDSLERKRKMLLDYDKEILRICKIYGINISDIEISSSMFTKDELETLYDEFYNYLSVKSVRRNPVTWLRNVCDDSFEVLAAILCVFIFLSTTFVIDIISIAFIVYLLYNAFSQRSLVKRYTVLAGIVFNVNPKELFEIKEVNKDELMSELSSDIDIDNSPEFEDLRNEVESFTLLAEDDKLEKERTKDLSEFTNNLFVLQNEYDDIVKNFERQRSKKLTDLDNFLNELIDKEKDLISEFKFLGEEFIEEYVLGLDFKVGFNPDTFEYEYINIGQKNIVFRPSKDKKLLDIFLKVLMTNMYCNVRPGFVDITIFDPNGLGRSMAGFYEPDIEALFKIETNNLKNVIDELQEHADKVIKMTKGKTLDEYNAASSEIGRTCLPYKLLIVLSQPKSIEETENLASFMEYSPSIGIFVWIVSDASFDNTYVFKEPFEGIKNPIDIDPFDFPVKVAKNLKEAFESTKPKSLLWNDFKEVSLPDNTIWTHNADEYIDMDVGFEDGDPSKHKCYTVGNTGDVHALCVGGTGAGKSVFVNNIIANVCSKYSPKDVQLWLVDFKGNEFNFFLKDKESGDPTVLPHIKACLCTSDPDYSVSLFKAFREEAEDRYKYLMDLKFKNMYEHNKAMRKAGTPEKCLPRVLLVVDEFQVIFEKTDNKAQMSLKGDITYIGKVARACGMHMFFTSQSMKGTVSDDVLEQFTLRFGLRCSLAVSQAIMGTNLSGNIRERNGFLYISSIDDKKKELQKYYKTPFIDSPVLRERIKKLFDRAVDENVTQEEVIEYEERTEHPISEVVELYQTTLKQFDVNNLFVLGQRMVYSKKGRISNIILTREDNQHIFSVFQNIKDAVMFFKTIMTNIQNNGSNSFIINSMVKDTGYLMEVDTYLDERNKMFAEDGHTVNGLSDLFKVIIDGRKDVEDRDTLTPLYIILIGWDKALGFGIDPKHGVMESWSVLLQTCGTLNVHFIFICTDLGSISRSIPMACNYRIAGKCTEKASNTLLDTAIAYKTYEKKDGYMFMWSNNEVERLKIYQSPINRTIREREYKL